MADNNSAGKNLLRYFKGSQPESWMKYTQASQSRCSVETTSCQWVFWSFPFRSSPNPIDHYKDVATAAFSITLVGKHIMVLGIFRKFTVVRKINNLNVTWSFLTTFKTESTLFEPSQNLFSWLLQTCNWSTKLLLLSNTMKCSTLDAFNDIPRIERQVGSLKKRQG